MSKIFHPRVHIQVLRSTLDKNNLSNVTVVAADGSWDISKDILKDQKLAQAIGVIGYIGEFLVWSEVATEPSVLFAQWHVTVM